MSNELIFETNNAEQTIELGKKIGLQLKPGDIIAYTGTLAAGKTTFTKGIADALNIDEEVTSPTFTIISEYEGKMPLYHIDAYRLNNADDFFNLGIDEMLYGKGVTVIEWTENVLSEIPESAIWISIEITSSESRKIKVKNWKYENIL